MMMMMMMIIIDPESYSKARISKMFIVGVAVVLYFIKILSGSRNNTLISHSPLRAYNVMHYFM